LKWAATFGRLDVVRFLVKNGAQVNARNHQDMSPLKSAEVFGHAGVARFLIRNGAGPSIDKAIGTAPPAGREAVLVVAQIP
jgi:ankyrin repeat protein